MAGRASLKDVAAEAGVSVSTASLALAGDRRVAADTTARVQAAATRLGYVRDPVRSSLASGQFRHTGKPVCIAACVGGEEAALREQAAAMRMGVRPVTGDIPAVIAQAKAMGAAALVVNERGADPAVLAGAGLPVVLWEDEGPSDPGVDLIETCEWWTATTEAIARLRAAGWERPAAVLVEASPRHWHDDVRSAACAAAGAPLFEWDGRDDTLLAFLAEHRPDAILGLVASMHGVFARIGCRLPFAALIVHDGPWFAGVAGWKPDTDSRCRVTLELVEMRLRYGPRPPRRIVIPPAWRTAASLPMRSA